MNERPDKSEYDPYFERYVDKVGDDGSEVVLRSSEFFNLFSGLSESQWNYSYAPGKWTLKEVLVHVMDTERIFAYRALRISRNDVTPLAGFEQDGYVENSKAAERTSESLLSEYKSVRAATLSLLESLDDEAVSRKGIASGAPISVRALAYMIAGHELHHKNIVLDKYLN